MKYRKKNTEIEAKQYDLRESVFHILHWVNTNGGKLRGVLDSDALSLQIEEGEMLVFPGDYIVRYPHGTFGVKREDHFNETYEEVN